MTEIPLRGVPRADRLLHPELAGGQDEFARAEDGAW